MRIARMDEIQSQVAQASGLARGGRLSFQDMLEAKAGPGGPRLDIPNDPIADLIRSGDAASAGAFATQAGSSVPTSLFPVSQNQSVTSSSGTPVSGVSHLPGPAFEPTVGVDAEWIDRLPEKGKAWAEEISAAANQHSLDPRLMAALVWSESAFNPTATSHAGAIGLAQLMPGTAEGLGVDPWDPRQNLEAGARYLKTQLDRFGSTELALAAYNAGPGRVERSGGIPQIPETQAYVRVVMERYEQLGGIQ